MIEFDTIVLSCINEFGIFGAQAIAADEKTVKNECAAATYIGPYFSIDRPDFDKGAAKSAHHPKVAKYCFLLGLYLAPGAYKETKGEYQLILLHNKIIELVKCVYQMMKLEREYPYLKHKIISDKKLLLNIVFVTGVFGYYFRYLYDKNVRIVIAKVTKSL